MDFVCGAFQPALIPNWLSRVGPVIAAFVAASIYWRNRRDAIADRASRRRLFQAMMGSRVRLAAGWCSRLRKVTNELAPAMKLTPALILTNINWLLIPGLDRLKELQSDLIKFGETRDAAIVHFVEACRTWDALVRSCQKSIQEGAFKFEQLPIDHLLRTADELTQRAKLAYLAAYSYDAHE